MQVATNTPTKLVWSVSNQMDFKKNVLEESITPSKTLKTFEIDPGTASIVCSVVLHNLGQGFIETTWVWDWKMGLEGSKKIAQKNL